MNKTGADRVGSVSRAGGLPRPPESFEERTFQLRCFGPTSHSGKYRADQWSGVGGRISPVSSTGMGHGDNGAPVW